MDADNFTTTNWTEAAHRLTLAGEDFVIATVMGVAGSAPRNSGSKMVIGADQTYASIGGGQLEFTATKRARELLANKQNEPLFEHFPLGASLGQCCGGSVTILFECIRSQHQKIELYGAGHVAHEVITILSRLPVRVRWIDSREQQFPRQTADNICCIQDQDPTKEVINAAPNSYFLIMTHNHQLDFSLCEQVLKRGDSALLGVIGSATKAERFRLRLQHKNYTQSAIDHLTCPVGLSAVPGKLPMEIAVSITADLIRRYQAEQPEKSLRRGLQWQQIKQTLVAHYVHDEP